MTAAAEEPLPRRQVVRERTSREIRDAARDLLRTTSAADLSLRAVARALGMTAPALYRYYDGRDALLEALLVDAYEGLTARLAAARDAEPADDPDRRLCAASFAYRRWALDRPHEFALVFGTPVPGFRTGDESPVHAAGARFGAVFLELVAEQHRTGGVRPVRDALLPPPLVERLAPLTAACPPAVPVGVVHLWLSAWARLHGVVSLEAFGHLAFTGADTEQLFRAELADLADRTGLGSAELPLVFSERPPGG